MRKTVDAQEIQNFQRDSSHWWNEDGPFYPLHRLNPVRMGYIRDRIAGHYGRTGNSLKPLKGLDILDIGCGGGLACEPLARLGANVTGIDADPQAVAVAQDHARRAGMDIDYRNVCAEDLVTGKETYDVVLALEIAEHVADLDAFTAHCAALCKPGGLLIVSTLNRTPQSFLLGIVAAEYFLRWIPRGTHNWKKFIRPSELVRLLEGNGVDCNDLKGVNLNMLHGEFELSDKNISVNYFISGIKL